MACKLRCPACKTMCKEQGDEMKKATGVYVVYTNHKGDRVLDCLVCQTANPVSEWRGFPVVDANFIGSQDG